MNLSKAISLYLSHMRSLGHRFISEDRLLKAFCKAVGDLPLETIESGAVLAFFNRTGSVTEYWVKKHSVLTGFYGFAMARGLVVGSPLPLQIPTQTDPAFQPYIYSETEIKNLLDASQAACAGKCQIESFVLRALLVLLYGAALRLGEALSLTIADVNLDQAILRIRGTKFFKSRLVPIGRDLATAMTAYLTKRNDWHRPSEAAAFFCFRDGQALTIHTVEAAFRRLRAFAGIRREGGPRRQPRLHDLRHSGVVHRVVAWHRSGADVQDLLPKLATYLGHVDLHGTQRYLTMTPELLREASRRFERYAMEVDHA